MADPLFDDLEIAVLLPCYNEEATIADVVAGFRHELPQAKVYVYDNNSHDLTAILAAKAGATVVREPRQVLAEFGVTLDPTATAPIHRRTPRT